MESKAWADDIKGEYEPPPPDPTKPRARKPHWVPFVGTRREIEEVVGSSNVTAAEGFVLRLLYASGMRSEELVGVVREDLRPELGAVQVGKRLVMLDEETFRALAALDWKSWLWNVVAVKGILRDAARGSTLEKRYLAMGRKLLPHALRVAFAAHWLEAGGGLFGLHQQLGYPKLGETENVIEVSIGLWRGVYDRAHPLALGIVTGDSGRGGNPQSQMPPSEVQAMIEACGLGPRGTPNWLMLRVIYAAGLRVSEVGGMVVGDVGLEAGTLFLRRCKEEKDRFALIDSGTVDRLRVHMEGRALDEPLFVVEGEAVKDTFIEDLVAAAGKKTGLLKKYNSQKLTLSPHSFRHAFASHLYQGGMEPAVIKRLMGHQSVQETMGYVDCRPVQQRAAYERARALPERTRLEERSTPHGTTVF